MKRLTIKAPVSLTGAGLHSGKECTLTFRPAPENAGLVFSYRGFPLPALAENVTATTRGTSLGKIKLVEHLLAAVCGLGIDDLIVELDENEPPALDGSAKLFMAALRSAGTKELSVEKSFIKIDREIFIEEDGAALRLSPFDGFTVHFVIEFPVIGRQEFTYNGDFTAIAEARTFGYLSELEELKKKGLARGASLENSLAIDKGGYVNPPRFPDEPVRHKVLDLVGDLALVGSPIRGKIEAFRSGHKLNVALARRIREECLTSMTS
ncbi:UDP-3-O-[3-hydroxymyristoyl] N-acetylglucosamine deacetylase [Candidatus Saganbacteria bacterium]|nr:UDP-3-O-[3-hydroxymyristoyl] N-acetylglucosamine deacetylase [Candidatus Saganbacteria bacterium]